MLSQDMIAKFPAAYAKLARQHASAELELIMEMARLYNERLLMPLEVDAVTEPVVIPKVCLHHADIADGGYPCGLIQGHDGPCKPPRFISDPLPFAHGSTSVEIGVNITLSCSKLIQVDQIHDETLSEVCILLSGHEGLCSSLPLSEQVITICKGKDKDGYDCIRYMGHYGACDRIPF